jgi:hypothetical protein
MLYTLSQARTQLKRFVDNGSCVNAVIDARVNEALERLTDNADFECMRAVVRIATCKHMFSLPYNVEKLLFVDVNGTPAKIFGRAYQFLSSGVGDLDYRCGGSCFRDILDHGEAPVQFDVPNCYVDSDGEIIDLSGKGIQLIAFSTDAADEGKTLKIRGFEGSGNGEEVNAGLTPGAEIPIHRWAGGVEGEISGVWNQAYKPSPDFFREVTEVLKPETANYISLFAVVVSNSAPETTHFSFLAKYHPRETIPSFRRYMVTNSKDSGYMSSILALVKLRNVPLIDGDDLLPIDSMQSLKLMVMAISEENKGNLQGSMNLEAQAIAVMMKRERSRTQSDGMPVILNSEYRTSLGRHMNHSGLVL